MLYKRVAEEEVIKLIEKISKRIGQECLIFINRRMQRP